MRRPGIVNVGDIVVQTGFWNFGECPGTQCTEINTATGAFRVTQFPNCGQNTSGYPDAMYGCGWGMCSNGTVLPHQISSLSSVTSDWSFHVGGGSGDIYDVAYDLWFCPDNGCQNGWNNGLEMMIWVNWRNVVDSSFNPIGPATLAGQNWDISVAYNTIGGLSWTMLVYQIQGAGVDSVSSFDLMAFIQDAENRGYLQNTWYLDAVDGGDELRSGGLPYEQYHYSVSVQ
jgi:hypothetical protein